LKKLIFGGGLLKEKYATVDLIEGKGQHYDKNIEIAKINSLILIANELAEANELKRKELVRAE
jgi:hypothetical protein